MKDNESRAIPVKQSVDALLRALNNYDQFLTDVNDNKSIENDDQKIAIVKEGYEKTLKNFVDDLNRIPSKNETTTNDNTKQNSNDNQLTFIQGKIYSIEEMKNIVEKNEQKGEMSIEDWEKYIKGNSEETTKKKKNSEETTKKKKKKRKNNKKNNEQKNDNNIKIQKEKKDEVDSVFKEFKEYIDDYSVHAKDVKKIKPNISEEWIKSLDDTNKKNNNIEK